MSEKEYVTVPCRVPAGLLKEGETLEIRKPLIGEPYVGSVHDGNGWEISWKVCSREGLVDHLAVIIPAFDANAWADKNMPNPKCEREVWAIMSESTSWCWSSNEPTAPRGWRWDVTNWSSMNGFMGTDEFKLPWQQSKFKWCFTWKSPDGNVHEQKGADAMAGRGEWRWVWQGGGK